jgi:hypothetical protein
MNRHGHLPIGSEGSLNTGPMESHRSGDSRKILTTMGGRIRGAVRGLAGRWPIPTAHHVLLARGQGRSAPLRWPSLASLSRWRRTLTSTDLIAKSACVGARFWAVGIGQVKSRTLHAKGNKTLNHAYRKPNQEGIQFVYFIKCVFFTQKGVAATGWSTMWNSE